MKGFLLSITFLSCFGLTILRSEELSVDQKQALLEELEDLEKQAKTDAEGRYSSVYQTCKKAMRSAEATMALYLDCLETLEFKDEGKTSKEFRNWKRRNKEQLSEPSLQRALQHQLSWLVLTLEVERSNKPASEFGNKALQSLDAMMGDAAIIAGNEKILSESVTESVFAKYFNVDKLTKESWPDNPLNFEMLFEELMIPNMVENNQSERVRETWNQRIALETTKAKLWGKGTFDKSKSHLDKLELQFSKFKQDELPTLSWEREQDVFQAGDETGAIDQMLNLIKSNRGHPDCETWVNDVKELLSPKEKASTEESQAARDAAFPNLE